MSACKNRLEIDYLKKIFRCNSEDGELRWRVETPRATAGQLAGTINTEGYIVVGHNKVQYRAHRIIWAMHYGVWPDHQIDHINGIKTDNRISNLRKCDFFGNAQNVGKRHRKCVSSHKGVDFHKGRWRARIRPGDGTRLELGYFTTEEEAAAAYAEAAGKFHGEFARV
jgi:hypothetical protein